MSGRLVVLSGPSGVGKGTLVRAVQARQPNLFVSVSATTRDPRPGERDGVEYHFLTAEQFEAAAAAGEFLEHAVYAGHRYGTLRGPVQERLARGEPVLLEIDLQGAWQVREQEPSALLVFLAPPSVGELARRLAGRGTEDSATVRARLAIAEREMAAQPLFDATIVNDAIGPAADRLVALVANPPTGDR